MHSLARTAAAARALATSARPGGVLGALVVAATACSPALDWREVRLDGGSLLALFPCKPIEQSRDAALLGARLRMTLHSCRADGATYALTHAELADPARAAAALAQMQAALAANLGSPAADQAPVRVEGMTPGAQATRLRLRGRLPDGDSVDEHALLFARGTHVYQAVVLCKQGHAAAATPFFDGLRLLR